jgi:alanine-synthesizing transaminase
VHYVCDEQSEWNPDIEDIKSRITPKTKAIVLINPNNPTGSVYSADVIQQIVEICRKHNLVLLSDEIYDRIVYDGKKHVSPASISNDILHISFNGLSKVFRVCGFSLGWMIISGRKKDAADFIGGLKVLSSLRPGGSVFAHVALKTALEFDNSIDQLIEPGGRLREQRDTAWKLLNEIPGITCVKPQGSIYMFPKIDTAKFNIMDDMKFILDLLNAKKILFVQGTGFNWIRPDHFRVVFLPEVKEIESAMLTLKDFLSTYRQ